MEKTSSVRKNGILDKIPKKIRETGWELAHTVCVKTGRLSFWRMVLLCCALRLLVAYPLGSALALVVSGLWLYQNFAAVKGTVTKALAALTEISEEERNAEEAVLWFEEVGRDDIQFTIAELSNHKVNTCNLLAYIEDFPPKEQWNAIKKELLKLQVLSQITEGAFYITWALPME